MSPQEGESRRYDVSAPGMFTSENLAWEEAVARIVEWFSDADDWGSGDTFRAAFDESIGRIEPPHSGGLSELQHFADDLGNAVKRTMGVDELDAELLVDEH